MKKITASAEIYSLFIVFFSLFYAFNATSLRNMAIAIAIAAIAEIANAILHKYNNQQ